MPLYDENMMLDYCDAISEGIPFTHPRACHLLYHLVLTFTNPEVVEVSCGYGKATLYLAAAAKRQGGFVNCVDVAKPLWKGKSAMDLLRQAELLDICRITFGRDARWYLLELLRQRPDQWIDLAYIDATHTVEVDSFVALAVWTHMRPGGILIFDDLDWIPAIHGPVDKEFSAPAVSHVQAIFNYISRLPDVAEKAEWGQEEVKWRWGFLHTQHITTTDSVPLRDLLRRLDNRFRHFR